MKKNFVINNVEFGGADLPIIAGPCVIESRDHVLRMAEKIKKSTTAIGLPMIFKSSFDKGNRSSHTSYRGPGLDEGLRILEEVKKIIWCSHNDWYSWCNTSKACSRHNWYYPNSCLSMQAGWNSCCSSGHRKNSKCEKGAIYGTMGYEKYYRKG